MVYEMRTDAELLNVLLNEAPMVAEQRTGHTQALSAKLIGYWTGRAVQTVSDYRTGKLNIPIDFWRRILDHYLDMRIVRLLISDLYIVEVTPHVAPPPPVGVEWFHQAVEVIGTFHAQQKSLADIIADGKVDASDAAAVAAYDRAFHEHRATEAALHRATLAAFENSLGRQP